MKIVKLLRMKERLFGVDAGVIVFLWFSQVCMILRGRPFFSKCSIVF